MKICIINHKRYEVTYVFYGWGNYYFTDKNNVAHLVDTMDVTEWADDQGKQFKTGIDAAIAYARYLCASGAPEFWWKVKYL